MHQNICLFSNFFNKIICLIKMLNNLIIFMILCRDIEIVRNILFFMINKTTTSNRDYSFYFIFLMNINFTLQNLSTIGSSKIGNVYRACTINTFENTLNICHFVAFFLLLILINIQVIAINEQNYITKSMMKRVYSIRI